MKPALLLIIVSALSVLSLATGDGPDSAPAKATAPPGYELVWSDEFNKPGLADPTKWDYEVGYIRNKELQYYTRARKENARVEDGCLVIEGRKDDYTIPAADGGRRRRGGPRPGQVAPYTAASLITKGKESWLYGRIEVRAKLPQGKGVWPAIWMLGTNITQIGWPACGEIDIMEFVGHTPDKVHATVHFRKNGRHASKGGRATTTRPFDDFHVYAVEWTPQKMDFYFDKTKYFTFAVDQAADNDTNCFHKPQYLLINLALGGSWGGKMDDAVLPQKYLIDYVRVYQQTKPGTSAAAGGGK